VVVVMVLTLNTITQAAIPLHNGIILDKTITMVEVIIMEAYLQLQFYLVEVLIVHRNSTQFMIKTVMNYINLAHLLMHKMNL
jgi:hypothetical protein